MPRAKTTEEHPILNAEEALVDNTWGLYRLPGLYCAKLLEDGTYVVQDPDNNRHIVDADEFNATFKPVSENKR